MRLTHPTRLAALLAPLILSAPLAAQVPGGIRVVPRAQASSGGTIAVTPRHLQTLQARLDSFAVALPPAERALWNGVLVRAAHAPAQSAAEVRVTPVLEIGPGGGCEDAPGMHSAVNRVAIIVEGGRTVDASGIIVQGGRTPREGIVVQGGSTPREGIVVQGGRTPPSQAGNGVAAIGPKQDDPAPPPQSLARRIADFSQRISPEERGVLNWLLTRAGSAPEGRPGTPGGRPGTADGVPAGAQGLDGFWWPPLPRSLGIDPRAIGPKQDDPAPPPPSSTQRWILRF
jgi:hypothetical protein